MGTLLVAWVCLAQTPARVADYGPVGDEVVAAVRDHFFDEARGRAWAARHAGYAAGLREASAFAAATDRRLAELGASHTRRYAPPDPAFFGLLAVFRRTLKLGPVETEGVGADFAEGRYVRRVFAGGPAEAAGLKRGDEVLAADGRPFDPGGSFVGRAGRPVTLSVRRRAGAPPFDVAVTPRRVDPKAEWLEAQTRGARVVERAGRRVACMPLFSCAGGEHEDALREALAGPFRGADALVLDFRDGWGGCSPTFLDLFNPRTPVLTSTPRGGAPESFPAVWRKPVVVLINGGTRSGKEVVAWALKAHGAGTLVGQRTAGAVLAGRPFPLSDGSVLFLAVADVRVDGERLEGVGVAPDVEVPDPLPHADGADPQFDRALDVAAGAVKGAGR